MITRDHIKKFPEVTIKFFEKEFALGSHDCLTLLIGFFDGIGIDIPRKAAEKGLSGITLENYKEVWESGGGREFYLNYLYSFTEDMDEAQMMPGDILVFEGPELDFWGIFLGFGNCIVCLEDYGTRVMPVKVFKLNEVRRIWAEIQAA